MSKENREEIKTANPGDFILYDNRVALIYENENKELMASQMTLFHIANSFYNIEIIK